MGIGILILTGHVHIISILYVTVFVHPKFNFKISLHSKLHEVSMSGGFTLVFLLPEK